MWSRRDVKKSLRRSQIVIVAGLQHASNVKPCLHSVYIFQKFIVSCCFSQYRRICIRYNIEANSWSTKDYIQYWLHLSSTLQSSLLEWLQTEDNGQNRDKTSSKLPSSQHSQSTEATSCLMTQCTSPWKFPSFVAPKLCFVRRSLLCLPVWTLTYSN